MAYTENKKPSGLTTTSSVSPGDLLIIQKAGETEVKKITVSNFMAAGAGLDYRAGSQALVVGNNNVLFSSSFETGTIYIMFLQVIDSSGRDVGYETNREDWDENGFPIWVDYPCQISFTAFPNR